MFDIPACRRSFSGVPLLGPAWLPLVLVPVVILLGVGLWYWLRGNSRQRFLKLAALTTALVLVLAFAEPGLVAFLPKDPGTPAGAIVILGRGDPMDGQRLALATQLWQAKRAPLIFVSGIYDGPRLYKLLAAQGIPASALDAENCSLTTPQNAQFTAAILQTQGIRQIILITDAPHIQRATWDFQSQGFEVIPRPTPLASQITGGERGFLIAREYFFLITTGLADLFRLRLAPDSELTQLLTAAKQYGQGR